MSVSIKHILQQGPVLAGMGRTILAGLKQKVLGISESVETPGPVIEETFSPRPDDLIRDYVNHVGGNPRDYTSHLPPHMFPQWGFALAPRTLIGLPYPIGRAMNGGCRIEINNQLPINEELQVRAQLVDVDDNGRRAVLHQKIVTETNSAPNALIGHLYVVIPLSGNSNEENGETNTDDNSSNNDDGPHVPRDAQEIRRWDISDNAGLDFAKLTGDFNPLHWVPPYARVAGFPNVILHGFSTMARAYEGVKNNSNHGERMLEAFDVKFTNPLVLPANVGLYEGDENDIYVADAPGGPAYMTGSYNLND